jgi:hypothetical protein
MTRDEVIASALYWGVDMRDWEEKRIQQIVDIMNTPLTPSPRAAKDEQRILSDTRILFPMGADSMITAILHLLLRIVSGGTCPP